jgi:hypothetical protein
LYFSYGDRNLFRDDFSEAWKQRLAYEQSLRATNTDKSDGEESSNEEELSIIVFRDNGKPLEIPCDWYMNDEQLLTHLSRFYYLQRVFAGIFEAFSMRSLNFIEVVAVSYIPPLFRLPKLIVNSHSLKGSWLSDLINII